MGMSDVRPVWLTTEEMEYPLGAVWAIVRARWDAAPADAAEAVLDAIGMILSERPYCAPKHVVEAVLRALGVPDVDAHEDAP